MELRDNNPETTKWERRFYSQSVERLPSLSNGYSLAENSITALERLSCALLEVIGFAFLNWWIHFCLARWGEDWGIRGITDVAVLPLAVIGLSIYLFLATPVTNTISRSMEFEADMYGLNAARQPDGVANVDMLLGEYRKLDPGPVEEFIFFDHPSGRTRIAAAMRWKAEYPESASPEELARPLFNTTP